jgi:hypothetical protein
VRVQLSLILAIVAAPALQAQAILAPESGSIAGLAVTASSRPIADVEVTLVELQRAVHTDTSGAYRFANLPAGTYTIAARRMGYDGARARVVLQAGATLAVDIELAPIAQRLEGVTVRADSAHTGLRFRIEQRAIAGGALFFQETLDSARGTTVAMLLGTRARGAHLVKYGRTGALLVASSRGFSSISRKLPKADPSDATSPQGCFSQVYLDGVQLYSPGSDNQPVPDLGQFDAASLEAVEFYPGPATTPVEYGGTGAQCGTILLWSRVR